MRHTPINSVRDDGRGHWPRGKPRHLLTARDRARLARVRDWLLSQRQPARPGEVQPHSLRSIATELGVSDRSVRKWLAGRTNPTRQQIDTLVTLMRGRAD